MSERVAVYWLGALCFVENSLLFPVLPRMALELELSLSLVGLALSVRYLLPAILAPSLGHWGRRFGQRRILVMSSAVLIASGVLYLSGDNLAVFLLAQVLGGLGYMAAWISTQTVATLQPDRAAVVSMFSMYTAIGFVIGPILGGVLLDSGGYVLVFSAYIGVAVMLLWFGRGVSNVSIRSYPRGANEHSGLATRTSSRELLGRPGLQAAFLFSFVCLFTIGIRSSFAPLFLEANAISATATGLILAAGPLGQAVLRPFTAAIMRRFSIPLTMTAATALAAGGVVALPIFPVVAAMWLMVFIHGLGSGLHQSVGLIVLADHTNTDERSVAIGLRATINQVATAGAPLVAGVIADAVGLGPAFFAIGGAMVVLVFLVLAVAKRMEVRLASS